MKLFLRQQLVVLLFTIPNATAKNIITETEDSEPIIITQPLSQLECEGNSVKFKVIASGSGLTYIWQRKRPLDVSFVNITIGENNTTFPSLEEIRLANVGSDQYPSGTQFQVIVSNGSGSVTSSVATLTVNEITNVTGGTNVTQCFGNNYSYTVATSYPANVVSYRWKKSIASGVWNEISDGGVYSGTTTATLKITGGTPAESGEYRVYVIFRSSGADCNVASTSRTRKITFLPQLTKPVTTITQPTCLVNTGTIKVTIQSTTDTYSFDNGLNFQASNEKSGLTTGSYNVIIKNAAGCVSPTMICTIEELGQPSTWDGTTWLNGTPDASRGIIFEEDFNSISDLEACSCHVTNGANVVINSEHTLTVTNTVVVVSGSLTFENNASLVQINDAAVNSGNINYKRSTYVNRYDYTYWSSPVTNWKLKDLSYYTLFDRYFSYNNGWVLSYNGQAIMDAGHGYIVRAPQTYPISGTPLLFEGVFTGIPNNGIINGSDLAVVANVDYLLGNPYPSAIDADEFLKLNSSILQGTLYFWTHNTAAVAAAGTTSYKYTASDYASYNRTGGLGVGAVTTGGALKGGLAPNGKIAAGQGFFAPAIGSGNVLFNNSMRIVGGASGENNSQFFKLIASATEKNRIWLNLINDEGAFKQTLIGYITGATNNYDNGFDAITYDGNPFVDFYSVNQGVNFAIQGRALPFKKQDSVALGYRSTIKGEFQISIDHTDGVLDSEDVFIEDNDLQILHDLKKESYSFTTEKGVFDNRFVLRYLDKNTVEEEIEQEQELAEELLNEAVIVSVRDRKITIDSALTTLEKVVVYTILGKKIFQKNKIDANAFVIPQLILSQQVVVVNIELSDGAKFNRKIIY